MLIDARTAADILAWREDRDELVALEDDPEHGPPDADGWHASDDEGARLLRVVALTIDDHTEPGDRP